METYGKGCLTSHEVRESLQEDRHVTKTSRQATIHARVILGRPNQWGRGRIQKHPWGSGKSSPKEGSPYLTPYLPGKTETGLLLSKKTEYLNEINTRLLHFLSLCKSWSSIYSTLGWRALSCQLTGNLSGHALTLMEEEGHLLSIYPGPKFRVASKRVYFFPDVKAVTETSLFFFFLF